MKVAAVTPIIGEFGYIVFDIQPKVRRWLREQNAGRKIIFAPKHLGPLFEEATEIIELPAELVPSAPATRRSIAEDYWKPGDPHRVQVERLVEWARKQVAADAWLEIPYFQKAWAIYSTYTLLECDLQECNLRESLEPYVVIAARAREFDAFRNWPVDRWDELVGRIRSEWKVDVRCIGRPPSTYFPAGAAPQNVEESGRLKRSIALLNNAICSISSNSGPTHLSLMSGCPTFSWGEAYLKEFVERDSNPLETPCHFYPGGWNPSVDAIWKALCDWREALEIGGVWQSRFARPVSISMCMIAGDSSRTIVAALTSIKPWVDEMIVIDMGSTDRTPLIARDCGAKVYSSVWQDSFSVARNESIRHARGRWIFWMDADDTIDLENGRKLRELVDGRHSPSTLGYVVQVRCSSIDGVGAGGASSVEQVKLFRRVPAVCFEGRIQEQVLPAIRRLGCAVERADLFVTHRDDDQSSEGRAQKLIRNLHLLELELRDHPDNTYMLFNKGLTLVDMGRMEEAIDALSRSLQLAEPGDGHIRRIYGLLARAYCELNRPTTALRVCRKGLEVFGNDAELLFRKRALEEKRTGPVEAENA